MKKLGEIAEITIGIVLNRKKANSEEQAYKKYNLFTIKGHEEQNYEEFYSIENLDDKCAIDQDILFRLTSPNKIISLENGNAEKLIIPSQFCIIRIKDKKRFKPSFIKILLETQGAQNQIKEKIKGTTIKSITITDLKKIEIPEIKMEKQEEISKIAKIWEEQKKYLEKLILDKQDFVSKYIEEKIKEGMDIK